MVLRYRLSALSFILILIYFLLRRSSRQVPGYLANEKALKDVGVDEVIIYCVNDGAVMAAWAEDQGVPQLDSDKESLIHLFADPYGEVTEKLEMELTAAGPKMVGLVQR